MGYACAVCGAKVNRSPKRAVGGAARVAEHFARGARCVGSDMPVEAHAAHRESSSGECDAGSAHPILVLNTAGRRPAKSAFTRRVLGALRAGKARAVSVICGNSESAGAS